MKSMSYEVLLDAVTGGAVAIRSVGTLQPAGGRGDKVFPPTYVKEGRAETKYALESRWIDGREVPTVLLDSVASQANRMEEALLESWERGELDFPVVGVDFSGSEGLEDLATITALQAPHRIADALLRDSETENGQPFRATPTGQAFENARPNAATGMFVACPTALVFGVWDSTGPKGGLGAKFQRCLVSEIVGLDVVTGVKTASRIDPAGIEKKAATVYERDPKKDPAGDGEWTSIEAHAARDGKGPKLFSRKGAGDKGTPATINHGNIPPSVDREAGGVTMEEARRTTVLSIAGLRRLRFPTDAAGAPLRGPARGAAEDAARAALAALGVAAIVLQDERGYDLRSRSLLVAEGPLTIELVRRDGSTEPVSVDRVAALRVVKEAAERCAGVGLPWQREPERLVPTPKLATLIRKSREAVAAGVEE